MNSPTELTAFPGDTGIATGRKPARPDPFPRALRPPGAGSPVLIGGERYLAIRDIDRMAPFLMSVVSDSDLWLFAGSNGGFTAGRVDPDHAIFPYRTADRILDQPGAAGALSLLRCDGISWEPWSGTPPRDGIVRNLYKHEAGTSVLFEEIHPALELAFRWELSVSGRFGLTRSCRLENTGGRRRAVTLLDGWHHVLPAGVRQETYSRFSYLAAAYMRHEAAAGRGPAIHTLNSGITDRAEPCESLRVAGTWSVGLEGATRLLSDRQVDAFRRGAEVQAESEARGVFGAHLLATTLDLAPGETRCWTHVADTALDHAAVVVLRDALRDPESLAAALRDDLADGVLALKRRIAGAGAIQQTADPATSCHHFANVLFNCMRGGTLHDNYRFPRGDFDSFLESRNRIVHGRHREWLAALPDPCTLDDLRNRAAASGDLQLMRLAGEYLPICFSRRHGDPSRPWNRFEIHTRDSSGRPLFTYAGNWRDIFQNWESLAYSYPACFEAMVAIFLNASTADGYNPYRITRAGIDWEVFDPHDPWSHIGYWGDHQIIYLLRLLEGQQRFFPGSIASRLGERRHTHAHVPYRIRGFDELVADPKHSIHFDEAAHRELTGRARELGGDGKLLTRPDGEIVLVTLAEKLLVPLLAKLGNLVPGGGIWLNTQRPEWNDANNALAGWGLSVVTVGYIRRYLAFLQELLDGEMVPSFELSTPVATFLHQLAAILPAAARPGLDDATRFALVEALGRAGEEHRRAVYSGADHGFEPVPAATVRDFIAVALAAIDATLAANRRDDHLFHSYNLLEISGKRAAVRPLDLMLEGQVSALSSGTLKAAEAVELLTALRASPLYREDQNSYLLYPDRSIVPFLERNALPAGWESRVPAIAARVAGGDRELLRIDADGRARFHPDLSNARDLGERLDRLAADPAWRGPVAAGRESLLDLWEEVFHHRAFTGRSGAMFGFEGLGSIYWHMVAKLLLAVQETHATAARENPASDVTRRLADLYDEVRGGLGFTKTSAVYGAFPTDPYSHSPRHAGAQQPGMTGQVKEEILTRMGELGVHIAGACVRFDPVLLKPDEYFPAAWTFEHIDLEGQPRGWALGPQTLAFTLFQVPVCYRLAGEDPAITLELRDGSRQRIEGRTLPPRESAALFARDGSIRSITVTLPRLPPPASNP
jgi:hypothetical protein